MNNLDMMGKPCPIPVIEAKKAMEMEDVSGVLVSVDNIVAVQNLEKMAKGIGYDFSYEEKSTDEYIVSISKNGEQNTISDKKEVVIDCEDCGTEGATILISKNTMGSGSDELGAILIKGFIFSLTELDVIPKTLIFLNSGVKLTVEGSNVLKDLNTLHDKGTEIFSCGTCLNYYSLTDNLAAGEITDMYNISQMLNNSGKVITI